MAIPNVEVTDTFDQWRVKSNEVAENQGDLDSLNTTEKTNIVGAVNETLLRANDIGTLASLDTANKTDIVSAINEVNGNADQNTSDISTNTSAISTINATISTRIPYSHDSINIIGNAGTTLALESEDYDLHAFTCDAATLTLTEDLSAGRQIDLIMTNAGSCTITWPVGTIWPGGTEPSWTAIGVDMVRLTRIDGSTILGTALGLDYS